MKEAPLMDYRIHLVRKGMITKSQNRNLKFKFGKKIRHYTFVDF